METAGFLAASLAYGRVQQIQRNLIYLFGLMGKSPFQKVFTGKSFQRKCMQTA
ncbi:MAG: DUF2400 family protein [Acidobacteriota bacterium]|nr:DUF2400 family protein [Acidobacteriota bacterium]